ncbi:MAG: sensor histidine kinase [Planctomycetota bacterium]|nr:MAG: sensor histidine kinase [Planctomycetota bacterium]
MAVQASVEQPVEVDATTLLWVLRWLLAACDAGGAPSELACGRPGVGTGGVSGPGVEERCWSAADLIAWLQQIKTDLHSERDGGHSLSMLSMAAAQVSGSADRSQSAAVATDLRRPVAAALVQFCGRLHCRDTLLLETVRDAAHRVVQWTTLVERFSDLLEDRCRGWVYDFAYGLSHELNNPLASIATRAGGLGNLSADPEVRRHCAAVVEHAMRGRELLEDMMAIAKPPTLQLADVDLTEVLTTAVERARRWLDRAGIPVEVRWDRGAALPPISADRTALIEAVWCLVRNAVEAMEIDGGCVEIRLRRRADQAVVEILDDGPGIQPAQLARVWHPYYSGREAGRGLGLGLAKVQRIARLHGGEAALENRAQGGCRATLTLPCSGRGHVPAGIDR